MRFLFAIKLEPKLSFDPPRCGKNLYWEREKKAIEEADDEKYLMDKNARKFLGQAPVKIDLKCSIFGQISREKWMTKGAIH